MSSAHRSLLASLVLVLLGCATKAPDAGDPPASAGDISEQPQKGEPPIAVEAEGPTPPRSSDTALPDCPSEAGPDDYCNAAGKLAGSWSPVDHVHVPEGAQVLFDAAHVDADGQPGLQIAISGTTLYVRHVSCGACRRVMGDGFVGEPGSLDETQLRAMQTKLGLRPDTPLLDSVEAWQHFASDTRGRAELDELSRRGR